MKNISGFVALAGLVMGSAFFSQAHAQTAWNTIASNAKVEIQESVQTCNYDYSPMDNGEVVILRVRNKTNASVNVSFRMDVYYNDQCVTCGNDEYVFKATLPANGVITGSCQAENP